MAKFILTHEINCNQDDFWNSFFDRGICEKLYREVLGYPAFAILEQSETDTQTHFKARMQPKLDVPGPVIKLLGADFAYTGDGVFDKSTKIWTWRQTPNKLADKIRYEGTLKLESIANSKVRRIMEIFLEAKIFGVGGLIESSFEKNIREEADATAAYFSNNLK